MKIYREEGHKEIVPCLKNDKGSKSLGKGRDKNGSVHLLCIQMSPVLHIDGKSWEHTTLIMICFTGPKVDSYHCLAASKTQYTTSMCGVCVYCAPKMRVWRTSFSTTCLSMHSLVFHVIKYTTHNHNPRAFKREYEISRIYYMRVHCFYLVSLLVSFHNPFREDGNHFSVLNGTGSLADLTFH